MKPNIDEKTVAKIAGLSRLSLTEQEIKDYAQHLTNILGHFEEVAKVNTDGIEPLVTPTQIEFHAREDEVKDQLPQDESLKNAPERSGYLFKVPPVIG